jgi:DNA-binding CsgD family transcriptional regulator
MQTLTPLQLDCLTPHELRIFNLAVQGLSLSAIQKQTGLNAIGIQTHKIRQKLGGFRSTPLMSAAYWRSQCDILNAENNLLKYQLFIENAN